MRSSQIASGRRVQLYTKTPQVCEDPKRSREPDRHIVLHSHLSRVASMLECKAQPNT